MYMYSVYMCTTVQFVCVCVRVCCVCTYVHVYASVWLLLECMSICMLNVHAGSRKSSIYVKGTNAFFLERLSLSSHPYAIDDTPKST